METRGPRWLSARGSCHWGLVTYTTPIAIWLLRTGMLYTFTIGDETLTILGVGRIGAPAGGDDDQKPKYIQQQEVERLMTWATSVSMFC